MKKSSSLIALASLISLAIAFSTTKLVGQDSTPKVLDKRFKISLFASDPDIVTPTGIAVDQKGRVFCIESHTHFRPKNYKGPKADRIRIFEDTNKDGKADKIINFFEGSVATMNMAFAPDGSLYVATRAKIFRLVDKNEDDKPEVNQLIVDLKTEGNYPHNGLSGLAFQNGKLYFGFGENLGVDYDLIGSDGTKLSGGGEGGNIFCCQMDGSELKKVATGFWNPFGLAFDRSGNLMAIDNDPDWRPPCRLLHIVEGGDYGYQFTHGRRGTHPFTAWFGELPGTLGMISGTGEAPSGMVRYDSISASQTQSSFLTTSWGLHSIEKYQLVPSGASFVSSGETVIKGEKNFRPVGIAHGPDGTLFISDWVLRSYELHGRGRIWKVTVESEEIKDPSQSSAPNLSQLESYPYDSTDSVFRQRAAILLDASKIDFGRAIQGANTSVEKASLIRRSAKAMDPIFLMAFLRDKDPFIRQAARFAIQKSVTSSWVANIELPDDPNQRTEIALIMRQFANSQNVSQRISELLDDEDPNVRLVALKWIGEENLSRFGSRLRKDVTTRSMTGKLFESYLAALDLIEGKRKGAEFEKAEAKILADILKNPNTKADTLIIALRKLQSVGLRDSFNRRHPDLKFNMLQKLLDNQNPSVVREAVQTIREIGTKQASEVLVRVANENRKYGAASLDATVGLSPADPEQRLLLVELLGKGGAQARIARQTLAGVELTRAEAKQLRFNGITLNSLTRTPKPRAAANKQQIDAVMSKLKTANADRGRLVFYNERFGQCSKCHQVDGRGGVIGPELSDLRNMSYERLLESIIQPSKEIAPRHTSWLIETYDGRSFTGILITERGEVQTYADANGKLIRVKFDDIERKKSVDKSIMPESLLDLMDDQEVADLIYYLKS